MTEDRVGDLLSVYLAGRAGESPTAPEELCRDCPELLAELRNRIVALDAMGRFVATTPGTVSGPPGEFPNRLGGYLVRAVLGRGGMGAVLLADDPALGRQVAVKVMLPAVAADPVARERFLREARSAAGIQHDHVVPIHHVGEEGGIPYLVMPLLRGEALEARLEREGTLPPAEVIRLGAEAAEGLAAAHAQNLIHRDVKPANLWLEAPGGRVKVLDFGLARRETVADSVTRSGTILGTPAYMAPEQVDGLKVDARADLFSLGASLYRAATGRLAFSGETLTAVLRAVAERNPPAPHDVDPAVPVVLSDAIMRLLAKKPENRPPSARAVADELARLKRANDLSADTVTVADTAVVTPGQRRRPWRGRILAVGFVLLLVGGLGVWIESRTNRAATADATLTARGPSFPAPAAQPGTAAPPPPTAPTRGSLDLLVHRVSADGSDELVPLTDRQAMPLHKGDHFRIVVAGLDRPAYLYLFWVDENGAGAPVHPWALGKWGTRPADEQMVSELKLAAPNGNGFRISGDAQGMETILLLARPRKLDASEDQIRGWFAGLKPLPFRGPGARVWFENFDVVRTDATRGIEIDGDVTARDGPFGLQATLEQRIGTEAGFTRAISFARMGPK